MSFLLDTNVLAEARKPAGNQHVRRWMRANRGGAVYLSVLVIGEVRQGIARLQRRDPHQAALLDGWLTTLRRDYAERILPVTLDIAELWGQLGVPDPLPVIDGLLAATALTHGLTLVTRNTGDVARTGVRLVNPFDAVDED